MYDMNVENVIKSSNVVRKAPAEESCVLSRQATSRQDSPSSALCKYSFSTSHFFWMADLYDTIALRSPGARSAGADVFAPFPSASRAVLLGAQHAFSASDQTPAAVRASSLTTTAATGTTTVVSSPCAEACSSYVCALAGGFSLLLEVSSSPRFCLALVVSRILRFYLRLHFCPRPCP